MKKIKNLAFKFLSILLINVFILEVLSFILIKINFIPGGLTPMVAFVADENFAVSRKKILLSNFHQNVGTLRFIIIMKE